MAATCSTEKQASATPTLATRIPELTKPRTTKNQALVTAI